MVKRRFHEDMPAMPTPRFMANVAWQASCESQDIAALWPEEQRQIARAVRARQLEYSTVRWCARAALQQLGHPPVAIVNTPQRDPIWPTGIVGSMTHCAGYHAAAVARRRDCLAIGIDAEPHRALPEGILQDIAAPPEQQMLQRLVALNPAIHWGTVLFSIKEAIFKAWFPLTRRWLDFDQANVAIQGEAGTFSARLAPGNPWPDNSQWQGRWYVEAGLILSTLVIYPAGAAK